MAYTTTHKGIVFIEGDFPGANKKGNIKADLGGFGAQLKTLNNVKDSLVLQAKLKKCNCVLDFKYGQKTSWISLDNVKFYGTGVASILEDSDYEKLVGEN